MPLSTLRSKPFFVLSIILCISILMGGCNALSGANTSSDPDGQFTSQEQALESGDDGGDVPLDDPGDVSSVALACPKDLTEFVLFVSHTWDFSPNRELDKMKVDGQTSASSPCPFSVAGSTVIMEECRVPITNTGFIQTDAGPCDISSSGTALISIEDASCEKGVITMTIVESIDPDSGSGSMNCPETSQPYFPLFPFSRTTREFHIQVGGAEASESADPDLSGQFMYNKNWTVHTESMISPLPEDSGE
jgi:hypothetical protein